MIDRISKLLRAKHQLSQKFMREPQIEELAEELALQPQQAKKLVRYARHPLSLQHRLKNTDDLELGDLLEDTTSLSPEETAIQQLTRAELERVFRKCLPVREGRVLRLRYGLPDGNVHTLQEIGDKMGISRERVRQIETQALDRLRQCGVQK
jgi:RNA polymerase primary sigma factor